jgi:outer membrane murein-binding lipoprotein Lpp
MKTTLKLITITAVALTNLVITGCQEKTPAEKAADSVKDAADKVGDAAKDAANKAEDAAKDAANEAKKAVK